MSDLRNASEKAVHTLILFAFDEFHRESFNRNAYRDAMSYLRDAERLLLNRQYGCHSGNHAGSACHCLPESVVPLSRATRREWKGTIA